MSKGKKVVVISTHSFFDKRIKVGMQYIAAGFASHGWDTEYISIFSSPFDIIGRRRRERFARAWLNFSAPPGFLICQNLTEYVFRALFPANRLILRWNWQLPFYNFFLPNFITQRCYDICVFDVTPTVVLLPFIKAKKYIFRLNDWPDGFQSRLQEHVLNFFPKYIVENKCSSIWAVSSLLAEYALNLNANANVEIIPNGVDPKFSFMQPSCKGHSRQAKSAVFVGSIEEWIDQDLITSVARLLPDWKFDFYGSCSVSWVIEEPNVYYKGSIAHEELANLLNEYEVGLIPFRNIDDLITIMERPLKFYEYVAAGLGIVSTDIGELRSGMTGWASFGNTPEDFAQAVVLERKLAYKRTHQKRREFVSANSWDKIIGKMINRLEDCE